MKDDLEGALYEYRWIEGEAGESVTKTSLLIVTNVSDWWLSIFNCQKATFYKVHLDDWDYDIKTKKLVRLC